MEDSDDITNTTVRRTRSGGAKSAAVVKTPTPAAKTSKQKPGPLSRKTRKKVVLMEVEVSDDEEEDISKSEKKDVTNEQKTEVPEEDVGLVDKIESEKVEINGSGNSTENNVKEDVALNDAIMCQEKKEDPSEEIEPEDNTNVTKLTDKTSETDNKTELENMEVDIATSITLEEIKNLEKHEVEAKSPQKQEETMTLDEQTDEIKTSVVQNNEVELNDTKDKVIAADLLEINIEAKSVKKNSEEPVSEVEEIKEFNRTPKLLDEPSAKKLKLEIEVDDKEELLEKNKDELLEKNEELPQKNEKDLLEKNEELPEKNKEELLIKKEEDLLARDEELPEKNEKELEEKNKEESLVKDEVKLETHDEVNVEGKALKNIPNEQEKQKDDTDVETIDNKQVDTINNDKADPDAENISEDELPTVQAVKVPEAEEVSDEELPGPKRAELPADTEVVSEDELPTVKADSKKEVNKRKHNEMDYDPGSPTSENELPSKKASLDSVVEKEKEEKPKPKKLPELDKYWKAVNDDPTDFTGWTYLLQYVDQENDMEAAREAYDAFLSHYPYCYGYWRKYADYEKRKGNKKKCEEVFERGLKAIPLSVDLWIHYLTYVKTVRTDDEDFIRSQFERALLACGLEFRSDRLWDSFIKWETEGKRLQKVTAIYDRLLSTPTQGYVAHFDNFQEHVTSNAPNKVLDVDEFLALRKEVRQQLKHDVSTDSPPADSDAPPGDEDQTKVISSDEETKALRERIISIRRKVHKNTVNAVTSRWNYEEGIKRPYFHVKPLERCQLKNWQDYLDYETEQGDRNRIIVLFERCLIACALYEEFWLKFVSYLENLKDPELTPKIRDVYERACTIHHLKKINLHLQWAMFEEFVDNSSRSAEILVNLEKSVPNVLQIAYRRINLERRRGDNDKCSQLYEHYINNSKNKIIASSIAVKYSRFTFMVTKDFNKAYTILKSAIAKDPNNPRLYLQLIDLTLQKPDVTEKEIIQAIDLFLDKDSTDPEQKVLFAQRKLEYLEDFGTNIKLVQEAHDQYTKLLKLSKDAIKKKESKTEVTPTSSKAKDNKTVTTVSQSSSYGNYGPYGNSSNQPSYPPYSGNQQGPNYYPQYGQSGDQYQYQNWQYPQGNYGGYNQWGGYSGGYGY